jgi:hypothetical protein
MHVKDIAAVKNVDPNKLGKFKLPLLSMILIGLLQDEF